VEDTESGEKARAAAAVRARPRARAQRRRRLNRLAGTAQGGRARALCVASPPVCARAGARGRTEEGPGAQDERRGRAPGVGGSGGRAKSSLAKRSRAGAPPSRAHHRRRPLRATRRRPFDRVSASIGGRVDDASACGKGGGAGGARGAGAGRARQARERRWWLVASIARTVPSFRRAPARPLPRSSAPSAASPNCGPRS
jgi:hypothetical protein